MASAYLRGENSDAVVHSAAVSDYLPAGIFTAATRSKDRP